MRKRFPLVIALALTTVGLVSLFAITIPPKPKTYARSRFLLSTNPIHFLALYNQGGCGALSNLLNHPENLALLASSSRLDQKSFCLEKVVPVRGTRIVYLDYSGPDSNRVQILASNAAHRIISYYATNQPSWQFEYIDSKCFIPPSAWERFKYSLDCAWSRVKYSQGW